MIRACRRLNRSASAGAPSIDEAIPLIPRRWLHDLKFVRIRIVSEEGVLLDLVDESEWALSIRVDEEGDLDLDLRSHCFGGWTTVFTPPGQEDEDGIERSVWWVTQEKLDADGLPVLHRERELSAAELIDKVLLQFESWILLATELRVEYLKAAGEFDSEQAKEDFRDGDLLRADLEQARAHARTWQDRIGRRYGDIYIYEMRDDIALRWERGQVAGLDALFVSEGDEPRHRRVYVAPDMQHGWRWTDESHFDSAGEYLPVQEVLARVPAEHRAWVRQQTDETYGKVVEAIAAIAIRACASDRPDDFAELARLATHAQALGAGREAEPFMPEH